VGGDNSEQVGSIDKGETKNKETTNKGPPSTSTPAYPAPMGSPLPQNMPTHISLAKTEPSGSVFGAETPTPCTPLDHDYPSPQTHLTPSKYLQSHPKMTPLLSYLANFKYI